MKLGKMARVLIEHHTKEAYVLKNTIQYYSYPQKGNNEAKR